MRDRRIRGAECGDATVRANGIDVCYDAVGDPAHPTILLVMGPATRSIA